MKHVFNRVSPILVMLTLILLVTSCEEITDIGPQSQPVFHFKSHTESLLMGESTRLSLSVGLSNVNWSSSEDSVATVNYQGIVKAIRPGKTIITAEWQGKIDSCYLVVYPKDIAGSVWYGINELTNISVEFLKSGDFFVQTTGFIKANASGYYKQEGEEVFVTLTYRDVALSNYVKVDSAYKCNLNLKYNTLTFDSGRNNIEFKRLIY